MCRCIPYLGVKRINTYMLSKAAAWKCSVKKLFLKFCKIYRKTPVLDSLFNKIAGLKTATILKRGFDIGVFL